MLFPPQLRTSCFMRHAKVFSSVVAVELLCRFVHGFQLPRTVLKFPLAIHFCGFCTLYFYCISFLHHLFFQN